MRSVVLFSGGLDSTVLLVDRIQAYGKEEVAAISFDYGQRHSKELGKAGFLAGYYQVEHAIVNIESLIQGSVRDKSIFTGSDSSQVTNTPVPKGHYEDPSMRTTFVPNRNMIMLSLAGAYGISNKVKEICFAAHAGDHAIYPDCRIEFVAAFNEAFRSGNYGGAPFVRSPFVDRTKAEIVKWGSGLHVPFDQTWSCYEGGEEHCGECGTCVERKEAFRVAGVIDPTYYQA